MLTVGLVVVGVSLAVALALQAFQENLLFFYSPTQAIAGEPPEGRKFRLGGLVEQGSMAREPGELKVSFIVTDLENTIPVSYAGVLPDLFREGQGVVAHGYLQPDGSFLAEEVLAKHDENYMAPEVADLLAEQGHPVDNTRAGPEKN
ncbi:MAG: cytochrome c maturation protein CcmE [Gammaproteobacteria bacterium]|jgi:cytochrome c-type biogenesis protein CcmE|nr:cytochrome c maturation protein CcmE [Gammaproteobacteria bacterium]